ncbi:MAG: NYN domain-containing protein [Lachnospiraceae bacterium]|nr:NYN domain-containing protein [Lachnospiraceae bacterium]
MKEMKNASDVSGERKYAILIDADNISYKYVSNILDEAANYGVATYKRVYGDLTKKENKKWEKVSLEYSLIPFQQFNYTTGKSSTDSAMIIDAMDILYSDNVDGFCIVSSDSDFTRLVLRLREAGCDVIGMGEQKTPKPFVKACSQFKYLDIISKENSDEDDKSEATGGQNISDNDSQQITPKETILQTIRKIINDADFEPNQKGYNMGELNKRLIKIHSDFDPRNYGYSRFSVFLNSFDFFEIQDGFVKPVDKDDKGNIPKFKTVKNAVTQYILGSGMEEMDIKDIKNFLEKRYKGFDISDYGYAKFSTFLKDFGNLELSYVGKYHNIMTARVISNYGQY